MNRTIANIFFAIADDWSYGHAGIYGCKWIKTLAIDRLACDGILFTQAYTPNGKCSPSRASIITGRSLTEIFKSDKSARVISRRDHVLLAKERTDIGRPNDGGYPIRGC
jgi:hypothetical protein